MTDVDFNIKKAQEKLPGFIKELWAAVNDPNMEIDFAQCLFEEDKEITTVSFTVSNGDVRYTVQQEWAV